MSDILCVTARTLCDEDFIDRITKIVAAHPMGIILREKDMPENDYKILAKEVMNICRIHNTPCILHSFTKTARELNCSAVHVPLPLLRLLTDDEKTSFTTLGSSCHSVEEAIEAEKLGCTYITAGHIFDTDCKKDLPGRGTNFLKNVCENVSIPVYAIGGISTENIAAVRNAGAKGACIMSSLMKCKEPIKYLRAFDDNGE